MNSYIYLIQYGEFINTDVYKVGRTSQMGDTRSLSRIKSYNKINSSYKEAVPAVEKNDLKVEEIRNRGLSGIKDALIGLGYKLPEKQADNK
jgi:hypothetical protein